MDESLGMKTNPGSCPCLLPGLHTYSSQVEKGAGYYHPSSHFFPGAVSGQHSVTPTLDTGGKHVFKGGTAALRSPRGFSPSGGGTLPHSHELKGQTKISSLGMGP